jgi:hypothetical protein
VVWVKREETCFSGSTALVCPSAMASFIQNTDGWLHYQAWIATFQHSPLLLTIIKMDQLNNIKFNSTQRITWSRYMYCLSLCHGTAPLLPFCQYCWLCYSVCFTFRMISLECTLHSCHRLCTSQQMLVTIFCKSIHCLQSSRISDMMSPPVFKGTNFATIHQAP